MDLGDFPLLVGPSFQRLSHYRADLTVGIEGEGCAVPNSSPIGGGFTCLARSVAASPLRDRAPLEEFLTSEPGLWLVSNLKGKDVFDLVPIAIACSTWEELKDF